MNGYFTPKYPRMRARDAWAQGTFPLWRRPGRTFLTALGTVIGVGTLVATFGVTATTREKISARFDALNSTEVIAQMQVAATTASFTPRDTVRAAGLRGVEAAGLVVPLSDQVHARPSAGSPMEKGQSPDVLAITSAAWKVLSPRVRSGRLFDAQMEAGRAHVAVVGSGGLRQLGMPDAVVGSSLRLNGRAFTVIGVIDDTARHSEALLSIVIPFSTVQDLTNARSATDAKTDLVVATRSGWAPSVARVLPAYIRPEQPGSVTALTSSPPAQLRKAITADVSGLLLILACVAMSAGIVGIANSTLLSVIERVPEIGLRRALGARRGQVAFQFVLESSTVGTLGGVLGSSLGILTVSAIAIGTGSRPVLSASLCLLAPGVGTLTGLVAGVYPAVRAARVDPALALAT